MADTPSKDGETATPGDSQTTVTPPAAPAANADSAEVERLRKEADQAKMDMANSRNELAKIKQEQEALERKQKEENEEFKQLYEAEREKRQKLEDDQTAAERSATLNKATEDIFKDYPTEVVDLAKTAGLSLSDDGEASQTALKEKLDAFKAKVAPNAPAVTSSNPNPSAPAETGQSGGLGKPRSLGEDDGNTKVSDTNKAKLGEYIRSIPAIDQMKRDAGVAQ